MFLILANDGVGRNVHLPVDDGIPDRGMMADFAMSEVMCVFKVDSFFDQGVIGDGGADDPLRAHPLVRAVAVPR